MRESAAIGAPSEVTSREPGTPGRAVALAARLGAERSERADESDDQRAEGATEQRDEQRSAAHGGGGLLPLLDQARAFDRRHAQRFTLLRGVFVDVERLGPRDDADADPAERRGERQPEGPLRVFRPVRDRCADAADDGDDERAPWRAARNARGPSASRRCLVRVGVLVAPLVGAPDPARERDERQQGEQPGGETLGHRAGAAERPPPGRVAALQLVDVRRDVVDVLRRRTSRRPASPRGRPRIASPICVGVACISDGAIRPPPIAAPAPDAT